MLVTHYSDEASRPPISHFDEMAGLVSISAVLYGMVAVIVEVTGGNIMFYILSQAGKAMRIIKAQHRKEFIEQYHNDPEFRAEVRAGTKDMRQNRPQRRALRRSADPVGSTRNE